MKMKSGHQPPTITRAQRGCTILYAGVSFAALRCPAGEVESKYSLSRSTVDEPRHLHSYGPGPSRLRLGHFALSF